MGGFKTNLWVHSEMRHRDDDWRDLGVLVLELGGLENVIVIKSIAETFLKISLGCEYHYLLERPVLLGFPESLKLLIVILYYYLAVIVSFPSLQLLLPFELHIN